jgi:hypothetical protein
VTSDIDTESTATSVDWDGVCTGGQVVSRVSDSVDAAEMLFVSGWTEAVGGVARERTSM